MLELSSSADVFWTALSQSDLLSSAKYDRLRAKLAVNPELSVGEIANTLVEQGLLTRFQADRLLDGRSRGFHYDHYTIVDLIGLGGMGWVYQAIDTESGEVVALKILRDDLKDDPGMLARFHQEAAVGLRLNHPNLMRTRGLGEAGGLPYMIMDFVAGPNLLEILTQRTRLPWPQACEVARQAALGLAAAHSRGIIHRDVKPQNLLIDSLGRVRVLDFGLSMLGDGETGDEFSLAMIFGHEGVGTLEYAAPEQAKDSLGADARSDLFSLGGTLFAALTGFSPLQPVSGKPGAFRREKLVSKFISGVPQPVVDLVEKLLAENPAERYASATEVAAVLEPWSKPLTWKIDYSELLVVRKTDAQRRLARLELTESTAQRLSRSTARPNSASSVVIPRADRQAYPIAEQAALNPPGEFVSDHARQLLRGTAADWGRAQSRLAMKSFARFILEDGSILPLRPAKTRLGRAADCELQIADAAVSQHHAELQSDGRRWWIKDCASRNGTFINGRQVQRQKLKSGDDIVIGQLKLRFEHAPAADTNFQIPLIIPALMLISLAVAVAATACRGL